MTMALYIVEGIKDLSISSVETYLQRTGWTKTTSSNPNALPYEGPIDIYGNPILVVLPARPTLTDAPLRINDVVRTVAAIEERSPESLVEAIQQVGEEQPGMTLPLERPKVVRGRTIKLRRSQDKDRVMAIAP